MTTPKCKVEEVVDVHTALAWRDAAKAAKRPTPKMYCLTCGCEVYPYTESADGWPAGFSHKQANPDCPGAAPERSHLTPAPTQA